MSLSLINDLLAESDAVRRAELTARIRAGFSPGEGGYLPLGAELRLLLSDAVTIRSAVGGWKALPSRRNPERLLPVGPFARTLDAGAFPASVNAAYFQEDPEYKNFLGEPVDRSCSLLTHFSREDVVRRLARGASMLAGAGMFFVFFDTYRPLTVQRALFDAFKEQLLERGFSGSAEDLDLETQRYISKPAPDLALGTTHASPHSTGAAVDLSIIRMPVGALRLLDEAQRPGGEVSFSLPRSYIDKICERLAGKDSSLSGGAHLEIFERYWLPILGRELAVQALFRLFGNELDMGTPFDFFGPEAASDYFERKEPVAEVRANRRLLYNLLHEIGFQNYEEEWWHYSRGDNMAARKLGLAESEYFGCELTEELRSFEAIRRVIWESLPAVPLRVAPYEFSG
jgi:D-alanyl-D-alanine dipeptidase